MKQLPIILSLTLLSLAALPAPATAARYNATVTVYVVEPVSRWYDGVGVQYRFGFLDFGAIEQISLESKERWYGEYHWNPHWNGFGDVTADNIMVMAVVSVDTAVVNDAYPPEGYWFNAYYVDAAAGATPGVPGENRTAAGFTHTVFVEEGTETG